MIPQSVMARGAINPVSAGGQTSAVNPSAEWGPIAAAIMPALIGGGISALGGFFTNSSAQRFSEQGSKHAYQRAMEDMRRAGLNPMLAFSQGGAQSGSPSLQNPLSGLAESVTSARRVGLETKRLKSEVELMDAQRGAQQYAGDVSFQNALRLKQEREYLLPLQMELLESQARNQNSAASFADSQRELLRTGWVGKTLGSLPQDFGKAFKDRFFPGTGSVWEQTKERMLKAGESLFAPPTWGRED